MANPFEDPSGSSPFGGGSAAAKVTQIFGEATEAAKASALAEASDMAKTANTISQQAKMAEKSGNVAWLKKLQGFAARLGNMLVEFIKKAIELAVFKLVLELCAMIMNAIVDALTRRGNQRMEITTPGVFIQPRAAAAAGAPGAAAPAAPAAGYSPRTNPFDYRPGAEVSPW